MKDQQQLLLHSPMCYLLEKHDFFPYAREAEHGRKCVSCNTCTVKRVNIFFPVSFPKSTNSVIQTVGHEACQKKQYTNRTYKNTTQNTYTDDNTTVFKYMYREQHDNRIIQYKEQQK
jgi:hypothetical protein